MKTFWKLGRAPHQYSLDLLCSSDLPWILMACRSRKPSPHVTTLPMAQFGWTINSGHPSPWFVSRSAGRTSTTLWNVFCSFTNLSHCFFMNISKYEYQRYPNPNTPHPSKREGRPLALGFLNSGADKSSTLLAEPPLKISDNSGSEVEV